MSIIIHGIFLFVLFLLFFWLLNSLTSLHDKVDEMPGSGAGVTTILLQLRLDRALLHDEIEGLRWQLDPVHQSFDAQRKDTLNLHDRLTDLLAKYDKLLDLVEKNAPPGVDFGGGDIH